MALANITIESTKAGAQCRKGGKWITKLHGRDEWVTISNTYPPWVVRTTCGIVPIAIDVRTEKVNPLRPNVRNSMMQTVRTSF